MTIRWNGKHDEWKWKLIYAIINDIYVEKGIGIIADGTLEYDVIANVKEEEEGYYVKV